MSRLVAPNPLITELLKSLGVEGLRVTNLQISIKPFDVVTATITMLVEESTIQILTKYAWKAPEKDLTDAE